LEEEVSTPAAPAAQYLRMSTKPQQHSPENHQRQALQW